MAATLATGGALSHHSGGALHELPVSDNGLTRVTVTGRARKRRIDAHRADLHPRDRTTRHGIPVTTVARTLVDLSHSLDDESLHRVVREAQFRGVFDEDRIEDALTRRARAASPRTSTTRRSPRPTSRTGSSTSAAATASLRH
jgi:hypothetical protein